MSCLLARRDRVGCREEVPKGTRELYDSELKGHLVPAFGNLELSSVTAARVRTWNAAIAQRTPVTAANCYRLLRTILNTAAADGLIVANPCTIKGAGAERTAERRIPTVETVYAIADEAGDRYRALVLTAALAGLRLG